MSAVPVIHVQAVVPAIAPAVPAAPGAMECISDQEGKKSWQMQLFVIAVIIIMLFAGKGAYKHLKGEGACCGGGSKPEIPKKKLDGTKLGEKTMKITGMHCENCVASVTRAINRIDGAAAKVSLKKGEAVVSYDREISNEELKKVVEDRGYHVVSIQ